MLVQSQVARIMDMDIQRPRSTTRSHTAPDSPASRISIDALLNHPNREPARTQHVQRVNSYQCDRSLSEHDWYPKYTEQRQRQASCHCNVHPSHNYNYLSQYHQQPYDNIAYSPRQECQAESETRTITRRSSSTNSSPERGVRDRYPSVSSNGSSAIPERRRPPRPKYDEEEMYFIWYHRVDLHQEWRDVRESFNAQFPNRPRSGFQGIQCKYYRFLKEKKCPTLREQRRRRSESDGPKDSDGLPAYGVVKWTNIRYPWMRPQDLAR